MTFLPSYKCRQWGRPEGRRCAESRSRLASLRVGMVRVLDFRSSDGRAGLRVPRRRTGRSPPRGEILFAVAATSGRARLERASLPLLVILRKAPQWVLFLIVLGAVVGGLLLTGPLAAGLLAAVAALLGWLLLLAWPRLPESQRLVRGLSVLIVAAAALWRLLA